MAQIANVQQSEAWNGYEGEHWAAHHDRYNAINGGFNAALLDAAGIDEASRVLDLGCGAGQTTRLAARRAHAGRVLGVDLSAPMLARARATALDEGIGNVAFTQGDVQVFGFAEGEFDAAISRFAVMFFADPVAAFGNVARALRPGGRLAFLSMPDVTGSDLGTVLAAAREHLPAWHTTPDPERSGPMSLSDPDRVRTILGKAGFGDVSIRRIEAAETWGRDAVDAAEFFTGWGPVRHHLAGADPGPLRAALTDAFRRFERDGAVRLTGSALLVEAVR
ncbi:class I SAM-dependent methyltransferase [Streptomyces sp. N35]|uniref:class I SAM-dependent methyltransferase n=1 Tax=Streptomyces sp. N35 TaxID=2795730 RepID=UPI0018F31179|nr:class I SAM-dependent methyltransferase [Streptomyces sp. N35]